MPGADEAVVLDASGRLRAGDATALPADVVATATCRVLRELLGRETSVVSCSVGKGLRPFAMTMLREAPDGRFLSGTASGDDPSSAVLGAVVAALRVQDAMFATIAERWKELTEIRAVSVIQGDASRPASGDADEVDDHAKVLQTMPAPGRLAVITEDREYRVLRFPAAALAVSTEPGAPVLTDVDAWMAKAEAMGP
jgi:hypothetical protein